MKLTNFQFSIFLSPISELMPLSKKWYEDSSLKPTVVSYIKLFEFGDNKFTISTLKDNTQIPLTLSKS